MMWLLCTLARLELETKQSVDQQRANTCWPYVSETVCLQCTLLDLFSHTRREKREADKERKTSILSFHLVQI